MEFKKDLQAIMKDIDAQKITTADILEDSTKALQTKLNQKADETTNHKESVATEELKFDEEVKIDAQSTKSEDANSNITKNKDDDLYLWAVLYVFANIPKRKFLSRIKALKSIVKYCAVAVGSVLLLAILVGITFVVLRACGLFG